MGDDTNSTVSLNLWDVWMTPKGNQSQIEQDAGLNQLSESSSLPTPHQASTTTAACPRSSDHGKRSPLEPIFITLRVSFEYNRVCSWKMAKSPYCQKAPTKNKAISEIPHSNATSYAEGRNRPSELEESCIAEVLGRHSVPEQNCSNIRRRLLHPKHVRHL